MTPDTTQALFDSPLEQPLHDLHPTDDGATLRHDMTCILLEVHRDRNVAPVFHGAVDRKALEEFAALVARRLAPLIGGRYIPKRDARAARDAALWDEFTGRNQKDMMRKFNVSRTLFYSIMARKPRRAAAHPLRV